MPLNVRIILSDTFSGGSSFYVVCVCNHCHWTSLNHRLKMGMTSHISCVYNTFSFLSCFFFFDEKSDYYGSGFGFTIESGLSLYAHFLKFPLIVFVEYFQSEYFPAQKIV